MPTRLIASSFALIAFTLALVMGVSAGNTTTRTLINALGAMMVCYMVGMFISSAAFGAIREHIEEYERNHPMPQQYVEQEETSPEGEVQTIPTTSDPNAGPDQAAGRAA